MISYKGIPFGFAPDWSEPITMAEINTATGQKAATYNVYSQITTTNVNDGSYDGNDQWPTSDIISSGAVLIASLMPEVSSWDDITTGLAESIASFFQTTFLEKGVTVWLRFAHEMNCYADASCNNGDKIYPNLDQGDFATAWSNIRKAVSAVNTTDAKIYMYWSPNVDTSSDPVAPWWPGKSEVDIVGIVSFFPFCQ
jgi:beta-mannanase